MTVDLNNESGLEADSPGLVRLATFALDQLRIHPQAELSILLVDEDTMSAYHQKYMGEPGPTDVLSFPMDELRPPDDDEDPPAGLLGDIVLCPAVTARQAQRARPDGGRRGGVPAGARPAAPARLRPRRAGREAEMFGLKDTILAGWASERDPTAAADRAGAADDHGRLGPAGGRPGPGDLRRVHRRRRGRPVVVLQVPGRPAGRGGRAGRRAGPPDRRRPAALPEHRAVPAHAGARSRPSPWWPWWSSPSAGRPGRPARSPPGR